MVVFNVISKVGLEGLVLGRRSSPDSKNKDVIVFGTYTTVSAWSRAQFKSGDGTFKITVKSFYQVHIVHMYHLWIVWFSSMIIMIVNYDSSSSS